MDSKKIYFAGDLFDHKHLIGNHVLAEYIDAVSQSGYRCILPQQFEQSTDRAVTIRDQDLKLVMDCDVALFNFDGTDLDSGTVVEFMLAKMLDIPCVLLRSDFRSAGDQNKDGDPWNLMVSNYPRSHVLSVNAMSLYQDAIAQGELFHKHMYTYLAESVVEYMQRSLNEKTTYKNREEVLAAYKLASVFPGETFQKLIADSGDSYLENLVDSKIKKGIYAWKDTSL